MVILTKQLKSLGKKDRKLLPKEPTVIPQDDIDAMVPSPNSMMPKALLDQYTKDEIFELMAYLESIQD